MFDKKTVIIVGAGASKEFGLPTAYELKTKMATMLDIKFAGGARLDAGDNLVASAFESVAGRMKRDGININTFARAARRIAHLSPQFPSIDEFIESQNDEIITICGKIGIVRAILDAEKRSLAYIQSSNVYNTLAYNKLSETWINRFVQLATTGCTKDGIVTRFADMHFIIF